MTDAEGLAKRASELNNKLLTTQATLYGVILSIRKGETEHAIDKLEELAEYLRDNTK
jgi:hypothetical protein